MAFRVTVVDDTKHVRDMLSSMLALDGFDVVSKASTGEEALEQVTRREPDVVVIDYSMPGMNGLETAKRILEAVPKQNIILYTAYLDDAIEAQARQAGVAFCLSKMEGLETLEKAIAEVCLRLGKG